MLEVTTVVNSDGYEALSPHEAAGITFVFVPVTRARQPADDDAR